MSITATVFGINPSMLTKWTKMRDTLFQSNSESKKLGSGRSAQFPELEQALYEWLTEQRGKKLTIKYACIKTEAKRLANELQLDLTDFKFSNSWINKFCRRYHLTSRFPDPPTGFDQDDVKQESNLNDEDEEDASDNLMFDFASFNDVCLKSENFL